MLQNSSTLRFIALASVLLCNLVDAASLRDPTLPGIGTNVSRQSVEDIDAGIVLSSIIHSGKKASAVINNRILFQGDSIQGVTVSTISADRVVLSDGRELTLFKAVTEEVEK